MNAGGHSDSELLMRLRQIEERQLQEAGRVLSAANTKLVQQIHDAAGGLPPGPGRDQVQSLAKSLLAGAEASHDAGRQAQAGSSQTDSLSQNSLTQTATDGVNVAKAGQGDSKPGGQAGPLLQLGTGDEKGAAGMYGGRPNADTGERSRVAFGKGVTPNLPSGDRADDVAEPKVDASDNKQTKSGKFREADDKHTDANTDIAPKIPLHKLDGPIEKNAAAKENDVDAGEADGAGLGDGSKSDFKVKARESAGAGVDADALADRVLAEAGYSMPNEFASQDSTGAEKPNKPGTAGAAVHAASSGSDGIGRAQDSTGDEKTEMGHRAADGFDNPAKAKDTAAQGDLKAKPPVHIGQAEAQALHEVVHQRAAAYYEHLIERTFTDKQRKKLAAKGYAMSDGSYPIETRGDLANAVQAFGRSPDDATKAHIKKRARALGAMDQLPEKWSGQESDGGSSADGGSDAPKGKVEDGEFEGDDFRKNGAQAKGALSEALRESECLEDCQIIEAVGGEGKEWDVLLIETGWSKNGNFYPAETLRNASRLFEGAYCFIDHSTEAERRTRPERSIRDKVGWFTEVRYGQAQVPYAGGDGTRLKEGIIGRFHLVDEDLRSKLREAVAMGKPDFIGFSIDATGRCAPRRNIGGRVGNFVEAITKVHSVDLVTDPAAGGQLMRLVAANRPTEEMSDVEVQELVKTAVQEAVKTTTETLTAQFGEMLNTQAAQLREVTGMGRVDAALAEARISPAGKERIREAFVDLAKRRDFTADEVQQQIREVQSYEAAVLGHAMPVPARFRESRVEMGQDRFDKFSLALQGWFEGVDQKDAGGAAVPRFRSIKEAYCRWYGVDALDLNPQDLQEEFFNFGGARGYNSRKDHTRVRESLTTASWGSIYADHLYLKLMRDYNMLPYTTMWQQIVSEIEDVPDFQTRHWDRVGGYSDLPVISEQGTYNTLTSPTNEEVTYSISKKGGLDDVTFEAIVNDRVGSIRRIPTHMARAAARTLWKTVFNMVTTQNPTMGYDSVALYNASHNNLDTNALSLNAMDAGIQKMRQQTAFGESLEILGPRNLPRTLIVPNQLEQRAKRIVNPSEHYLIHDTADTATNIDPASFTSYGINVLVYDVLTSSTGWFMVADPQQVETMVVGFLNGQQEPEMFVQDQPNVGSVFSADKITYKIRHIYGVVVLDHRSFYKGNS